MPELPEVYEMSEFINSFAKSRKFVSIHSSKIHRKGCEITLPKHWKSFSIRSVSRGKELKMKLTALTVTDAHYENTQENDSKDEEDNDMEMDIKASSKRTLHSKDEAPASRRSPRLSSRLKHEDIEISSSASSSSSTSSLSSSSFSSSSSSSSSSSCSSVCSSELNILFNLGMSGYFHFRDDVSALPSHSHLWFVTSVGEVLFFQDVRRFGGWKLQENWSLDRSPCPFTEFTEWRAYLIDKFKEKPDDRRWNWNLCESMLEQDLFNGVGNYLRAEILYSSGLNPFLSIRQLFSSYFDKSKKKRSSTNEAEPFFRAVFNMCKKVISAHMYYHYDLTLNSTEEEKKHDKEFEEFLQCYGKAAKWKDRFGRTFWYNSKFRPKRSHGRAQHTKRTGQKRKRQDDSDTANETNEHDDATSKETESESARLAEPSPRKQTRSATANPTQNIQLSTDDKTEDVAPRRSKRRALQQHSA